jgi:hypothetical protein
MAELLVRAHDKTNVVDFYANCQCTKRGDVVVAQADGWTWGAMEKTDPQYRIIRVFGLDLATASTFCAPELPIDPLNPSKTLQTRQFKLDIDNAAWPAAFPAWLADDTRTTPMFAAVFANVLAQIALLKILKSPIVDPNVIGLSPNVIG